MLQRRASDRLTGDIVASPPRAFWEHPVFLGLLLFAVAIPLLGPPVPPLTDLPGHMGRYHVQLNLAHSPELRQYYGFDWAVIGNLGVDLLIVPMARLFGLELGTKLIVLAIPVLTAAGFLLVAREVHGRIPPTALFALPLTYSYPFQFGFVNFALSVALCFLALALWIRLGRNGRFRLRALLFVPIGCLIWLCHIYGWGMLGVLAFGAEAAAQRDRGRGWFMALLRGALGTYPLLPPVLLMLTWRSGDVEGVTADWFNWEFKGLWLIGILHERWATWDKAVALFLMLLPLWFLLRFRPRFATALLIPFLIFAALFVLLPRILLGSAYADMRLAPFAVAVGILGIAPQGTWLGRHGRALAAVALLLFAARTAVTTTVFSDISDSWKRQLAAIEHIDHGKRVLVLISLPCFREWRSDRMEHIGSLAVVRRSSFVNGQWAMAGAQLMTIRYRNGQPFVGDPSQMLRPRQCYTMRDQLNLALQEHDAFDYLWLANMPPGKWPSHPQWQRLWSGPTTILYRSLTARPVGPVVN